MSGLTNDDFRRIMATPRHPDLEETIGMTPRRLASSGPVRTKPARPSGRPPRPSKPESLLPPGYRDRAQERRDREQAGDDTVDDAAAAADSLPAHLTAYLGGDEDRTHLVKGLDYLLLERSRDQIQHEQERRLEQAMAEAAAPATVQEPAAPTLTFSSAMARSIYERCIGATGRRSTPGAFRPGHTVYQFETDVFGSSTLPTILHRSDDDCGPLIQPVDTRPTEETRRRLQDVMNCIREGRKPPRPVAPQGPAAAAAVPPAQTPAAVTTAADDADDDIFADVGEYVCEPRAPDGALPVTAGPVRFAPDTADNEEPVSVPSSAVNLHDAIVQARSTAGRLGVYEKDLKETEADGDNGDEDDKAKPSSAAERLRALTAAGDFDEYTVGGDDSDEEMDGRDRKRLSATKISKTKMRTKQKLNSQWQQISSMIDKRKEARRRDGGPDDGSASKRSRPD